MNSRDWRGFFFGLTLVLCVLGCGGDKTTPPEKPVAQEQPTKGPALFEDVTSAADLQFEHANGMSGQQYYCEMMGPGGAFLDYDNDGDLDIYLPQGAVLDPTREPDPSLRDRLFRNDLTTQADGTQIPRFVDVTDSAGIDSRGYAMGVTTGDIDNDGWVDLYVINFGPNLMLRNNGDGTFDDVTASSGTDDPLWNVSASFADYDRDGWLDLFIGNYVDFRIETHKACFSDIGVQDYCGPLSFTPLPDRLFRNRGDGTFEDVSIRSKIVGTSGGAMGVVSADFNADGWIDFYVANDATANQLWINRQDGTFEDQAPLGGCALNLDGGAESSMGLDAGDFDGDGDEDLFMTHLLGETNTLYVNDGNGWFEDRTFDTGLGVKSRPFTAFGAAWVDYDNDGWLDLMIANGEVKRIEKLAREGDPYPLHQTNQLFRNDGAGKFVEVTDQAGSAFERSEVSRGAVFGDVDNDGDEDVLIVNNNGPARLLLNRTGQDNNWLGLRIVEGKNPRDALGARVSVALPDGRRLWRRVNTDGSYGSAHDPRVVVGLGTATEPGTVTVYWPDGSAETWNDVAVGAYTTLARGSGQSKG